MARIRDDAVAGSITDDPLLVGATTINSAGLADLSAVASPDVAALTLWTEDANGRITAYEIVHVTAHTAGATSATITRGEEDSSAQEWAVGSRWSHGVTADDIGTTVHWFDAGADATTARPSVPAEDIVIWTNTPSEPTNLGARDQWEDAS